MKKNILLIFITIISYSIKAQIPLPSKTLQSPNTASLGLYGEIPVSCFTGTPSINIPLYNIKYNTIEIPISLSYHSAGIRPEQHPGWVGLGWNLNSGGAIYRKVNDSIDEFDNKHYFFYDDKTEYSGERIGFYYSHNILDTPRWNQTTYFEDFNKRKLYLLDSEPDEFNFNFLGYSGKFYLDHLGHWQVQCDKPVKVTFDNVFLEVPLWQASARGYSPTFGKFTIHGEDGTKYIFGGDTNSIEYSVDFMTQRDSQWQANAWHLSKIISPNGDEIDFTYERGDFINQMYESYYYNSGTYISSKGSSIGHTNPSIHSFQGQLISPVYLAKITTPFCKLFFEKTVTQELKYNLDLTKGEVDIKDQFVYLESQMLGYPECENNLKWYKLDNITIKTNDERLHKKIKFKYNNKANQRLMLDTVCEEFPNDNAQTYTFKYDSPELLPPYCSGMTDHWGFCNNTFATINELDDSNNNIVTEQMRNFQGYKEPNTRTMHYGILNKIIYPTGGYTRFIFEPHSYRSQLSLNRCERCELLSSNHVAGGLRIKKILQSNSGLVEDEFVDKEYFYVNDYLTNKNNPEISSGVLGGQAKYNFENYTVFSENRNVEKSLSFFSSQSLLPASSNTAGNHIGYSEVVEKRADGSFTLFKFTNFDNNHMDESADANYQGYRTPYEPYNSKECERGKVTLIEKYSNDYIKRESQSFVYEKSSDNFVRSLKLSRKQMDPAADAFYIEGTAYRNYTYTYRIAEQTEHIYNNALPISTTTKYKYNRNGLIRDIEQTVNNGTKKITYKHPEEFSDKVYSCMIDSNILSPIIEESESLLTSSGTILPIRKKRTNYVPLKAIGRWNEIYAISSIEDSISPSVWKKSYECFNFDTKGNPISVNINEKPLFYQWGYDKQYPVAIFEGAKNDYKVTPKYQEVWTTENIALKHDNSYQNSKIYNFYTSRSGSVEFRLTGALGYNWYVTGRLDDSRPVQLVQIRTNGSNEPWRGYYNAYSYKVVIDGVAAGAHTFRIDATDSYKGTSDLGNDDGNMTFSYWKSESTSPEITGNNDVLYQNFEDFGTYNIVPFGFHSSKSYAGPYEVELTTNPNKSYTIDYQVLKNGKWCYTTTDFKNGRYTIDEGTNPIDEIRVYPKDATVTSCTYIPCVGIRSKTNERGITESYEYDFSGRIVSIKENEQSNIKSFDYKYYNQSSEAASSIYYNTEIKKVYINEGCDSLLGEIGQPIEYVVPAKKYSSSISQEDANQKAYDDLIRNGQQYANEHGECTNNIVLSVYNPYDVTYVLNFCWGRQGSLRYDLYPIPPSERINNTGDILQDYKPVIVQLPRNSYRSVNIELEGGYPCDIDFSIRSSEYKFNLMYDINNYPDYRETYVIGGYPFLH